MAKELPAWVFEHVQKCRDAFGIGHAGFEVHVHRTDVVDGDPDVAGEVHTASRYHNARVTLKRSLKPDDTGYEVVTHELLHAAMGSQRRSVNRILDLVPEKLRGHAEAIWQDGNEETVTQIARGLTPLLRLLEKGKE